MHSNVWCDKNLCSTNSCDLRMTHIIHIIKSDAEICRLTVYEEKHHCFLPKKKNKQKNPNNDDKKHLKLCFHMGSHKSCSSDSNFASDFYLWIGCSGGNHLLVKSGMVLSCWHMSKDDWNKRPRNCIFHCVFYIRPYWKNGDTSQSHSIVKLSKKYIDVGTGVQNTLYVLLLHQTMLSHHTLNLLGENTENIFWLRPRKNICDCWLL